MNIILSPHFDDAALSLGGLLAREGANSLVANFFTGTPQPAVTGPWDSICGFADSTEAVRSRTIEDRESLTLLGVAPDRIRTFSFLDAQYRFSDAQSERPAQEPELQAALQKEIEALAAGHSSTPLKIFIPGTELHVDHRLVKHAAQAAMSALARRAGVELFFYQCIPYSMTIAKSERPQPWRWNLLERLNWKNGDYSLLEKTIANGAFKVSPQAIPLTKEDMRKKISGVKGYVSQINQMGRLLFLNIRRFSAAQAAAFSLREPYCEIVYRVEGIL